MRYIIEFPMDVVQAYHGSDNVNSTLDKHITPLVQKYFTNNGIGCEIIKIDYVDPVPNTNDELVRYELEVDMEPSAYLNPKWILQELEKEGYEKGFTIKNSRGEGLYADAYTPDIPLRRNLQDR